MKDAVQNDFKYIRFELRRRKKLTHAKKKRQISIYPSPISMNVKIDPYTVSTNRCATSTLQGKEEAKKQEEIICNQLGIRVDVEHDNENEEYEAYGVEYEWGKASMYMNVEKKCNNHTKMY